MRNEEFDKIVDWWVDYIKKTLKSKGEEYTLGNEDRLKNFKRAADMLETIPEKALIGYMTKHIISILDLMDKLERDNKKIGLNFTIVPLTVGITRKLRREKLGDLIIYSILLDALLEERKSHD
jgi:hypothetical protein